MPSGHASLAMGWFTLLFLDASVRTHPFQITGQPPLAFSMQMRPDNEEQRPFRECFRAEIRSVCTTLQYMCLVPWVDSETLTHLKFITYISVWCFIMVPVPFMRVVLYDHSVSQAFLGTLLGPTVALLWWRFVRYCQHRCQHLEGERFFFGLLIHNYKLPRFHLTRHQEISANTGSSLTISLPSHASGNGRIVSAASLPEPSGEPYIPNSFNVRIKDGRMHPEEESYRSVQSAFPLPSTTGTLPSTLVKVLLLRAPPGQPAYLAT